MPLSPPPFLGWEKRTVWSSLWTRCCLCTVARQERLADNDFRYRGETEEFHAAQQDAASGASMPLELVLATGNCPIVNMPPWHGKKRSGSPLLRKMDRCFYSVAAASGHLGSAFLVGTGPGSITNFRSVLILALANLLGQKRTSDQQPSLQTSNVQCKHTSTVQLSSNVMQAINLALRKQLLQLCLASSISSFFDPPCIPPTPNTHTLDRPHYKPWLHSLAD